MDSREPRDLRKDAPLLDGWLDFRAADVTPFGTPRPVRPSISWTVVPEVVISPREAFFAPHATLRADEAIGRVSAELVAPYPPGIPVLAPGERITREAVEGLREAMADGTQVRYAADRTLETFQVVAGR